MEEGENGVEGEEETDRDESNEYEEGGEEEEEEGTYDDILSPWGQSGAPSTLASGDN
jgi:hypothetical protein